MYSQLALMLVSLAAMLLFFVYRALVITLVAALVILPWYFLIVAFWPGVPALGSIGWGALGALTLLLLIHTHKPLPRDNPYRRYVGWPGWVNKRVDQFIAWIGTLKYFTSPPSLVEEPGSYKIRGDEIRALIDGVLQPGDILLRGFDGYLDGVMIRLSDGGRGLARYFSHAALYLGDLNAGADRAFAARRLQVIDPDGTWRPATDTEIRKVREDPNYFQTGRQKVVHAMTRGVFVEDILTFTRCDYLEVLRLPHWIKLSQGDLNQDYSLIDPLPGDARVIRDKLKRGGSVSRADVLAAAHRSALGKIGSCYDFQFNDGKEHNRFSCSEFVYYCYKSIHCYLGLQLKRRAFAGLFFARDTITPGDIHDAALLHGKLQVIWTSQSLKGREGPR